MARHVFPDNGDRIVFSASTYLHSGAGVQFRIYANAGATVLADIQTLLGVAIAGSTITVGEDSLLPEFLGPNDGTKVLYAHQVDGTGPVSVIQAKASDIFQPLIPVGPTPPPSPLVGDLWVDTN